MAAEKASQIDISSESCSDQSAKPNRDNQKISDALADIGGASPGTIGAKGHPDGWSHRSAAVEDWPPSPDLPGPLDPEVLPIDLLPRALRQQVESVAEAMQVPTDMPAMLALGCLSAAAAGLIETEVRSGWREPAGIYVGIILPPASRKSPAYAAMTAPLREWEAEQIQRAEPAVAAARDRVSVLEKALEAAIRSAASGKGSHVEVAKVRRALAEAEGAVPLDGRLLGGDITAEEIVRRMAAQGGRLAILEPEPGPLQILAGRYSDQAHLDELKKAWSAESIIVDRVGRPSVRVDRPGLTLTLCLQPGVIEALPHGGALRGEGALARFQWCTPPHGLGSRLTGADVPPLDESARKQYARVLQSLLAALPGHDPQILTLSAAALEVVHALEAEVEVELAEGGAFEMIRDWAGKMTGQAVRVATLLALADRNERGDDLWCPIDSGSMAAGAAILRALATHALKVLCTRTDGHAADLCYLLRHLRDLPQPVTLSDLRAKTRGRKSIPNAEALSDLVAELEERGCLRLVQPPSQKGRPPSPVIDLHPAMRPLLEGEI